MSDTNTNTNTNTNTSDENVGLGRLVKEDTRDKKFLLPRRAEATNITSRYWTAKPALDQGATPQCVGFSGYQWLTSFPIRNKPAFTPTELYKEAQKRDEWPGEDYAGSSVRGCFKVLKDKGFVSEYLWAETVDHVVDHLLTIGPVVVGTRWSIGMFMADNQGYIDDIGGNAVGGHAYLLIGANRLRKKKDGKKGAVRVLNSWGPNWGDETSGRATGRAWLSFKALEELMEQDGEACTATELLLPA